MSGRGREVLDRLKAGETLVFDGGYGTMLFAAGLLNGACPELWNDTHADVVAGIHKGYFDAGSHIVETNTFGGTRMKLDEYQIGDRTSELRGASGGTHLTPLSHEERIAEVGPEASESPAHRGLTHVQLGRGTGDVALTNQRVECDQEVEIQRGELHR